MDSANPTQAEIDAELNELRAGLRAFGKKLALHVQGLTMPDTPLEAERTARMVRATDQMLIQVYAPTPPPPQPREARAVTASNRRLGSDDDDDDDNGDSASYVHGRHDTPAVRKQIAGQIMTMIRVTTRAHAQATGFWPDGQAYDPDDKNWMKAAESELRITDDLPVEMDGNLTADGFNAMLLRRYNAQTRFQAEKRGVWPDDRPYSPRDLGFWAITANMQMGIRKPAKDETPGPGYLPDWIIRRSP